MRSTAPIVRGFNPRPRTGGDSLPLTHPAGTGGFNPRPRTGGDEVHQGNVRITAYVSIRAPARGATSTRGPVCFNPRPRTGGDMSATVRKGAYLQKVSIRAPARGATGAVHPERTSRRCFNPRPRTGGDVAAKARLRSGSWFQSAPPHGGRIRDALDNPYLPVSIRAPARGATVGSLNALKSYV